MKRIFALVLILFFATATTVYAQTRNIKRLSANEVTTGDHFSASERVEMLGTVSGDLYSAGEEVFVGGVVEGDLLAVAGNMRISGVVNDDVRVAGGTIVIDGTINGNITAAGGRIEITQGSEIQGNVTAASGEIIIDGKINGNLTIAAGTALINGIVVGNSQIRAESIQINSQASINGDFTYWSENNAQIDESASISGAINQNREDFDRSKWRNGMSKASGGVDIFSQLVSIVTTSVVGSILIKYFPRHTDRAVQTITKKVRRSFVVGLVSVVAVPVIFILLLITVIAFPLSFAFFFLSMIYIYMARIFGILAIGTYLSKKANFKKLSTTYIFLIGLISYYALSIIPVIGDILKIVIILVSVGGAVINEKKTYKLSKKLGTY